MQCMLFGPLLWASPSHKAGFLRLHNISQTLEVNPLLPPRASTTSKTDSQRFAHLLRAIEHVPPTLNRTGMYMEFGVRQARMLSRLAKSSAGRHAVWHGFDSFEGLPETSVPTDRWKAGQYSLQSRVPQVGLPNVKLHKGWFNETLSAFFKERLGPVAFMHMDADIYESTRDVRTVHVLAPDSSPAAHRPDQQIASERPLTRRCCRWSSPAVARGLAPSSPSTNSLGVKHSFSTSIGRYKRRPRAGTWRTNSSATRSPRALRMQGQRCS
jgi:hypothetical protein